ncbi:MAG TPA: hypothetical protein PKA00_21465 [Saprospiraceae bacterium]|nr:hypothetical protein [Saprospiraceae bacterium]HMQ85494.1 hypothetical protein [Saprospiraceae bacterium]
MFSFSHTDWYQEYLNYRKSHPLSLKAANPAYEWMGAELTDRFESLKHPLYLCMQQSGILYGFPVYYPFYFDEAVLRRFSEAEQAKLILLDTLLYAGLLQEEMPEGAAYEEALIRLGLRIQDYYRGLHWNGAEKEKVFTEEIIFHRVRYKKSYFDFAKNGVNTHLFWDLYFFNQYLHALRTPAFDPALFFPKLIARKKEMKRISLQIISAAAHADWKISPPEQHLIRLFKFSSRLLSQKEKQEALQHFKWGIGLEDILLPELDWMARRYLLDLAILCTYSDSAADEQENAFIQELLQRLHLDTLEISSSKGDLGCFLYLYGKQLRFYKARQAALLLIGQAIIENMAKLGKAAKMEYVETREMAITFGKILPQLLKSKDNRNLPSEKEISAAFKQLKDIPKFLPFLSFVFLPVPGITELYILLAFGLEKYSGGLISLLPSQVRQVVLNKNKEEEEE